LTGETIRAEELSRTLSTAFPVTVLEGEQVVLDHASLVPLLFLSRTWGQVPPRLILANPLGLTLREAFDAGKLLRSMSSPEKWALVASGDLSHCLSPEAPGGFTPQGAIHDQAAQNALEMSSPAPLFALSTSQVEQAGECGLRSLLVFLGLARGEPIHTLSYEAPFGVGYCTAFWHGEETRKGM
jgi:aromatic ring-opening dioxygenase LigB subunit